MAQFVPESLLERAELAAREAFDLDPQDSVFRDAVLRRLGGAANSELPARRLWAEAWQLLARAGLICREPDARDRDLWFLTPAGAQALAEGDFGRAIRSGLSGESLDTDE